MFGVHKKVTEVTGVYNRKHTRSLKNDATEVKRVEIMQVNSFTINRTNILITYRWKSIQLTIIYRGNNTWITKTTKLNKALGPDGILVESIKCLEENYIDLLDNLFKQIN